MKKLAIFGAIIVILFAIIITLTNIANEDKLKDNPYGTKDLRQSTIDLLGDKNYQNIILPDTLEKEIESGEGVVGYFFSPECVHCKAYTPKLMKIANELNIEIDKLNVLEYPDQWEKYAIKSTPTLIYFKDGKEVARMSGDAPNETTTKFFNDVILKK